MLGMIGRKKLGSSLVGTPDLKNIAKVMTYQNDATSPQTSSTTCVQEILDFLNANRTHRPATSCHIVSVKCTKNQIYVQIVLHIDIVRVKYEQIYVQIVHVHVCDRKGICLRRSVRKCASGSFKTHAMFDLFIQKILERYKPGCINMLFVEH